jgi:integrase
MGRKYRRGEGSVYQDRANGCWWARYPLGVVNGKRVGKKVRAPTREAAEAELEGLRRIYRAGGDPSRQTLDAYLADWLASHGPSVRESTRVSYAGHVNLHISPLLGGMPLRKVRPADVRRLIAHLSAQDKSPATVGRIVTTLRIALGQAVRDGAIADNPASAVRLPRVEREPVQAMTEAQAAAIIEAAKDSWMRPLIVLLLGSGLRLGEACGLDQGDVGDRFVLVRRSKTTVRAVPISDDAAEALRLHLAAQKRRGPKEPLFLGHRTSERLRPASVSHAFPLLLTKAGLARMTPHGLRHGVATLLVARGVHMRVVADQLGHRNPAITAKVYAHVLPEASREAVRLLNRRAEGG